MPSDPWEAVIQQAEAEIHALIESGNLAPDKVTAGWIEISAGHLYRKHSKLPETLSRER